MRIHEQFVLFIPYGQQPVLEVVLISFRPAFIVAEKFCGIGELVALETCQKVLIVVIGRDLLADIRPVVENIDSSCGAVRIPFYLITQTQLESSCGIFACDYGVIFIYSCSFSVSTDENFYRRCLVGSLCKLTVQKSFP